MFATKEFLRLQYGRICNDEERKRVEAQYKLFAAEREKLIEAYIEILLVENPTVYASSIYWQQPGKTHITGLWRSVEQAIEDLEQKCSNIDYDAQRNYAETKKPHKLSDIKDKSLLKNMALRELAQK